METAYHVFIFLIVNLLPADVSSCQVAFKIPEGHSEIVKVSKSNNRWQFSRLTTQTFEVQPKSVKVFGASESNEEEIAPFFVLNGLDWKTVTELVPSPEGYETIIEIQRKDRAITLIQRDEGVFAEYEYVEISW
jgi:hypothetical protein